MGALFREYDPDVHKFRIVAHLRPLVDYSPMLVTMRDDLSDALP